MGSLVRDLDQDGQNLCFFNIFSKYFSTKNLKRFILIQFSKVVEMKEMGLRPSSLLLLFALVVGISCKGDLNDFNTDKPSISPARIAQFYTVQVVQSASKPAQACAERVFQSRKQAVADGKKFSLGVEPTVGVGVFAAGIAQAFQLVRKYVYHDADNLDTAFDAGGKVSIGLTATTIVSQWTWSATLLQSSTVASKYGISGPYWCAGGATIQIIIFSILLKTRAPGAKPFLQVIKARFVKGTHLVFCT